MCVFLQMIVKLSLNEMHAGWNKYDYDEWDHHSYQDDLVTKNN